MITIHSRVATARETLRAAGIPFDEAELDARLLAQHLLGWTTERFFAGADVEPPATFDAQFDALIGRRASREPFAYIVGHQEFWGLQFEVSPAVMIPRPETELIVEVACEILADEAAPATIADVGTGSGCVAIAIARERPRVNVVATDVEEAAIAVARHNAGRLGVGGRLAFRHTDLLDEVEGPFDLIVSNPPYVRDGERTDIQPEVRFEPADALYAGADGLDVIRRLIPMSGSRLTRGGTLVFEFGFGQADAVAELISSAPGIRMIGLRRDLQDIPRVAIAARI